MGRSNKNVYLGVAGADPQDMVRCAVQISNMGNVRLTGIDVQDVDAGCLQAGSILAVGAHINCTATRCAPDHEFNPTRIVSAACSKHMAHSI